LVIQAGDPLCPEHRSELPRQVRRIPRDGTGAAMVTHSHSIDNHRQTTGVRWRRPFATPGIDGRDNPEEGQARQIPGLR